MTVKVKEVLADEQSPFQRIEVVESEEFGKFLLLDGHIQLTTFDEFAYHEALVQIPLLNLPQATSALVVGGGDGGVLRELCKSSALSEIEMVEIDEAVIRISREVLPTLSNGAFEDPRVKLQIGDAFPFVKSKKECYDLIVVDSTDTYEEETGEISEALFTQEFYQDCLRALKPGGIVVTQADNSVFCPYSLEEIRAAFAEVFPVVEDYFGIVPLFGGYSAFVVGTNGSTLHKRWEDIPSVNRPGTAAPSFRYLTPSTYDLAFNPPRF